MKIRTKVILLFLLLGMMVTQVSAQTSSQLELTNNNSQVELYFTQLNFTKSDGTYPIIVGLELVSLGSGVSEIYDIILDVKMESQDYFELGQVSFLDRSTDSLSNKGDKVETQYTFTMKGASRGSYTISAKVTLTERVGSVDVEYKSAWRSLVNLNYIPPASTVSEEDLSVSEGVVVGSDSLVSLNTIVVFALIGSVFAGLYFIFKEKIRVGDTTMKYNDSPKAMDTKPLGKINKVPILACPHCGTKCDDGDMFCPNCGSKLA